MKDGEAVCANCGSEKNVIEHHLSYKPEITVPLCRSCHSKFHFSTKPAKVYERVGGKGHQVEGLFFKNYNLGTVKNQEFTCLLCVFDGSPSDALNQTYSGEDEFLHHLMEEHFPIDWSDFDELKVEGMGYD